MPDGNQQRDYALQVNPELTIIELSCRSGEGLDDWYRWLKTTLAKKQRHNETRS